MSFLQSQRLLQTTILAKLELDNDERAFIENNRFTKVRLTQNSSSSSDNEDVENGIEFEN